MIQTDGSDNLGKLLSHTHPKQRQDAMGEAAPNRSAGWEHISGVSSNGLDDSTALLCSMQSSRGRSHAVREDEELLHAHIEGGEGETCDTGMVFFRFGYPQVAALLS